MAVQKRRRPLVRFDDQPAEVRTAAGLDVTYDEMSDELVAAVAVLDVPALSFVDSAVRGRSEFPCFPGLFAFREAPPLLAALRQLSVVPEVLFCDGQGLAHRHFGLACHLGVLTELPGIGVGKTLVGRFAPPAEPRGAWTSIEVDGEEVGAAPRTQVNVKPAFVPVGHRCRLDAACDLVLVLGPRYRLPETSRAADRLSRGRGAA